MATNTSNNTSNASYEFSALLHASHCIPWIILLTAESLATVVLNLITFIVFATQRQLRRKTTYWLIRNLAIVDLLAGGISGPLQIERVGVHCNVWQYDNRDAWARYLKLALVHLFSMASLGNLVAMSLERVHAIFFPFKHRVMRKWVYKVVIAIIWLTAIIRESVQIALAELQNDHPDLGILINSTLYLPYYLISLLLVCVSYISIFIKTRSIRYSKIRRNSVITQERQLTSTLFVVTVVSLLTLLPVITFISVFTFLRNNPFSSSSLYFHIRMVVVTFFLANSLANPIVYSMRMQAFRAGLAEMFGMNPYLLDAVNLPLRYLS